MEFTRRSENHLACSWGTSANRGEVPREAKKKEDARAPPLPSPCLRTRISWRRAECESSPSHEDAISSARKRKPWPAGGREGGRGRATGEDGKRGREKGTPRPVVREVSSTSRRRREARA
eukprot:scaffold122082_cov25-Tisochrysis_lutea.AAC.1